MSQFSVGEIGKPGREALRVGPTSFVLVPELEGATFVAKLGTSCAWQPCSKREG